MGAIGVKRVSSITSDKLFHNSNPKNSKNSASNNQINSESINLNLTGPIQVINLTGNTNPRKLVTTSNLISPRNSGQNFQSLKIVTTNLANNDGGVNSRVLKFTPPLRKDGPKS